MALSVGDAIPDVQVTTQTFEGPKRVQTGEVLGTGKVVLFAVPGAFTPTCSDHHLPGFVMQADEILAKGVDRIACISVNDAFVMGAWGNAQGTGDKILMLADGNGAFTAAMGLELDLAGLGLGVVRSAMPPSSRTASSRSSSSRPAGPSRSPPPTHSSRRCRELHRRGYPGSNSIAEAGARPISGEIQGRAVRIFAVARKRRDVGDGDKRRVVMADGGAASLLSSSTAPSYGFRRCSSPGRWTALCGSSSGWSSAHLLHVLNGGRGGQTLGKMVWNIRVRDAATGGPLGPARAARRYLIPLLALIPILGLVIWLTDGLWPLWDRRRQALHDKLAGSAVVPAH